MPKVHKMGGSRQSATFYDTVKLPVHVQSMELEQLVQVNIIMVLFFKCLM